MLAIVYTEQNKTDKTDKNQKSHLLDTTSSKWELFIAQNYLFFLFFYLCSYQNTIFLFHLQLYFIIKTLFYLKYEFFYNFYI